MQSLLTSIIIINNIFINIKLIYAYAETIISKNWLKS